MCVVLLPDDEGTQVNGATDAASELPFTEPGELTRVDWTEWHFRLQDRHSPHMCISTRLLIFS